MYMQSGLTVSRVEDAREREKVFRLRYKVYCQEWGFEKHEDNPKGMETDRYDSHSVHFSAKINEGDIVGTIRLILDSPEGFPIENNCDLEIRGDKIPRERLAEISRLAISRDCRRRSEDKFIYGPDEDRRSVGSYDFKEVTYRSGTAREMYASSRRGEWPAYDRRWRHEILIGLCKAAYHESKRKGLTHWYAIMTKGLHYLLSRYGIEFQPIGGPVDYHGIRTPYLAEMKRVEANLKDNNPVLFNEFTEGLEV